jgi:transposase
MSIPGPPPLALVIPAAVRPELEEMARSTKLPHGVVQRAQIALAGAAGRSSVQIAQEVGCEQRTVRKWKERFRAAPTIDALRDKPRPGRPSEISLLTRLQVVQAACRRPDEERTPFRDLWTYEALAQEVLAQTQVLLSVSEIGRILRFNHLRPHKIRYWLNTKDPEFGEKAARICDLYMHLPPGAVLYSVDEKPIQVVGRKYPAQVGPDGEVRQEYEYIRRGTCCLLAAFEVGTGQVIAQVVPHRTAEVTVAFLESLAQRHPTGDVYVVWDNLNTHKDGPDKRWTMFNERHGQRFHFVYTPIHASWLNQVEVWFSIVEKRVLKYADFASVTAAAARVVGYVAYWNEHLAHPFRWTWRYRKTEDGWHRKSDAAPETAWPP